MATRLEKMARKVPIDDRQKVIRIVLSYLEDMYGGEGWDDPRLVGVTENWIDWPLPWGEQVIDPYEQAQALADQSFDPRDIVSHLGR